MTGLEKRSKKGRRKARPEPHFACPCCNYVTLSERGKYLICPICFWEDEDVYYDTNPREPSAANHGLTLTEGRDNFRTIGACEGRDAAACPARGRPRELSPFPSQDLNVS